MFLILRRAGLLAHISVLLLLQFFYSAPLLGIYLGSVIAANFYLLIFVFCLSVSEGEANCSRAGLARQLCLLIERPSDFVLVIFLTFFLIL